MDTNTSLSLAKLGASLAISLSAVGSGLGIGAVGMSAVGAWKKCFLQNKPAPFILLVFVGAPITQTFYGMIVMFKLLKLATEGALYPAMIGWGLFSGTAIGLSAWMQGRIAACASDALSETGQGFNNYLMALGIIESVAIFVMVFTLIAA